MSASCFSKFDTRTTAKFTESVAWQVRNPCFPITFSLSPPEASLVLQENITGLIVSCVENGKSIAEFELIPSIHEMGYYGQVKAEERASEPTWISFFERRASSIKEEITLAQKFQEERTLANTYETCVEEPVFSSAWKNRFFAFKDKWRERLEQLKDLEKGWDSYDADPPTGKSISNAREFLNFLRATQRAPDALNPSTVGGVGFTFRKGKRSVYIEFRNTGNSHVAFMGNGQPRVEKVVQDLKGFHSVMHNTMAHLNE